MKVPKYIKKLIYSLENRANIQTSEMSKLYKFLDKNKLDPEKDDWLDLHLSGVHYGNSAYELIEYLENNGFESEDNINE